MYVAIGLVVVFVLLVLRCYVCKPNKNSQDEDVDPAKSGSGHNGRPARSGVLGRMARGVYASLPMASPPAMPHRTGKQPPARAAQAKGAPSRGSGDDEHSTDDEDYDIESCRTPPRRGRDEAVRTPPCTPGTPTVTVGSSPYRAIARDKAATTRTIVLMHDVLNPDGSVSKQATEVELPIYDYGVARKAGTAQHPIKPRTTMSPSPTKKAFPALTELSQGTPHHSMPSKVTPTLASKSPFKRLSEASANGTDITSVSTLSGSALSGSASTPRAQWRVQGQSPPRQQAPQYQQRTPSPQQHLQQTSPKPPPPPLPAVLSTTPVRPVVRDGIASPSSEPPTPIKSAEKKRGAKTTTSPTKRPSTGSSQRARRNVPAENDGSRGGVLSEVLLEEGWTIHIHRSGKTFFHNDRCVRLTAKLRVS
jgi:hypothetical protein